MGDFRYTLDQHGNVVACGYGRYENTISGEEPFFEFEIIKWKKNIVTGEWVYLPDITPVNKTITEVRYDWSAEKVYITIADQYRPGPYEFDCTRTWTDADCQAAIEAKFSNNI